MSQCERDELSITFKITNNEIQVSIPSQLFAFSARWLALFAALYQAFGLSDFGNQTLKLDGVPTEGVKIYRSASSAWYKNLEKEVSYP